MESILLECLKRGLRLEAEWDKEREEIVYLIPGFSKSSYARCYIMTFQPVTGPAEEFLECHTRYDQVDHIRSFEDLAYLADDWWRRQQRDYPTPPSDWADIFIELGIARKTPVTKDVWE